MRLACMVTCLALLVAASPLPASEAYRELSTEAFKRYVEKAGPVEGRVSLLDGRVYQGRIELCRDGITIAKKSHVSLSERDSVTESECVSYDRIKKIEIKRKGFAFEEGMLIGNILVAVAFLGFLVGRR